MKKLVLIVAFLLACNFRLSATEKNDIIKEIWDYYEKTINSAKYTNSKSEVWSAMYSVASGECETMLKESESRGFLDAETKSTLSEKTISMELLPLENSFKVSFTIKYRFRYLADAAWNDGATPKYKTKIKLKVYEALKGTLELFEELQKKVDDYNALQTKSRKKIVKGDDY